VAFWICILASQVLWSLRHLEIAICGAEGNARRFASARLVDDLPCLACWSAALTLAYTNPADDTAFTTAMAVGLAGGFSHELRLLLRASRYQIVLGPHMPFVERHIPMNINLYLHRLNEFMYLMLGETVLQLVIARHPLHTDTHMIAVFVAGFLIVLCMLYSYQLTEPNRPNDHAIRRSALAGVAYFMLYSQKALSVLLAGVGIKIAIYNPDAAADAAFALEQRLLLGLSLMLCFFLQMLMAPLHIGLRWYYRHMSTRLELELVGRLGLLACMGGICAVELKPWAFVCVQAVLSMAQIVLLHEQQRRPYHPLPTDHQELAGSEETILPSANDFLEGSSLSLDGAMRREEEEPGRARRGVGRRSAIWV